MMKTMIMVLGLLGFGFSGGACLAQECPAASVALMTEGVIESADWVAGRIVVNGVNGQVELEVPEGTSVSKGSAEASAGDLEQGTRVQVEYVKKSDGSSVAKRVLITDPI